MASIKEFKAICSETGMEIIYGVLTTKNSMGKDFEQPSCSCSTRCSKVDCVCKSGEKYYKVKKLGEI